jgi:hypothetical protein
VRPPAARRGGRRASGGLQLHLGRHQGPQVRTRGRGPRAPGPLARAPASSAPSVGSRRSPRHCRPTQTLPAPTQTPAAGSTRGTGCTPPAFLSARTSCRASAPRCWPTRSCACPPAWARRSLPLLSCTTSHAGSRRQGAVQLLFLLAPASEQRNFAPAGRGSSRWQGQLPLAGGRRRAAATRAEGPRGQRAGAPPSRAGAAAGAAETPPPSLTSPCPLQGKVVFVAPTRPLVAQQIDACYAFMGIPRAAMAELTGAQRGSGAQRGRVQLGSARGACSRAAHSGATLREGSSS